MRWHGNIACPCEFAQAPTDNKCEGVLAYRINEGTFGDTDMAGLNVVAIIRFAGDLWAAHPVQLVRPRRVRTAAPAGWWRQVTATPMSRARAAASCSCWSGSP